MMTMVFLFPMQSFYRFNSFKNPIAAADVVNAVNALLEMGGDESLDLASGPLSETQQSEESSSLTLTSDVLDEVHQHSVLVLFEHIVIIFLILYIGYFQQPS